MRKKKTLLGGLLALAFVAGATVKDGEEIEVLPGKTLIHLTVEPSESADALFAGWPVDWVAYYDAAAFDATQQYSAQLDAEGLAPKVMKMWYADKSKPSDFTNLQANAVYLVSSTNKTASYRTTVYGEPRAARCVWHATPSTNSLANYIGLALDPAAGNVRVLDFMRGFPGEIKSVTRVSGYGNVSLEAEPSWGAVTGKAGEAFAFMVTRATDWSGPVRVAPVDGVDFGTNLTVSALTLRNDSDAELTVSLSLEAAKGTGASPLVQGLLVRRPAAEGGAWVAFSPDAPCTRTIAVGASEVVAFALDRSKNAAGEVGGLIRCREATLGTHWQTTVPVKAKVVAAASDDWRRGLWVADATVETTSYVNTNREIVAAAASGRMKLRLPVYFGPEGRRYLLQRVETYADTNGTPRYVSGTAVTNAGWTLVRRYSSVVLPVHHPVIAAETNSPADELSFAWTVDADSRDNPFRHARHPDHDGLSAKGVGFAPSGDDPMNYLGDEKPELFSLTNRVRLTFSAGTDWTPQQTLYGTFSWEVGGAHAAGPLSADGSFTMTHRFTDEVLLEQEVTFAAEDAAEAGKEEQK